jgi:amino acid transporter
MLKPFVFSAGLMLSPDILATVGNLAGRMPAFFLLFLGAGALCHTVTSRVYSAALDPRVGPFAVETELIRRALGPGYALFFSLFPRLLMFLCLSTSVLATAGYVFNEVFVYWFPNLGFSFCLLGLLLALNLSGKEAANLGQVFFISVSILGLLVLVIAGFARLDLFGREVPAVGSQGYEVLRHLFPAFIIFVGFELSLFSSTDPKPALFAPRAMVSAILGIGLVLGVWGLLSLAHVSPERLAESALPHALAARAIMGQRGRVVMGIVAISGACGAVNALLASVSRFVSAMAQDGLIPTALVQVRGRPLVAPALLGVGGFAMMGAGMAGSPMLEHLVMAGAWFWLASYGAVHLSFQLTKGFMSKERSGLRQRIMPLLSLGSILFIGFVLVAVIFSIERPDALKLVKILITVPAVSVTCSAVLLRLKR